MSRKNERVIEERIRRRIAGGRSVPVKKSGTLELQNVASMQPVTTRRGPSDIFLLSNLKPCDDVNVPLGIDSLEVIQQSAPSTNHHQETTPARVVLLVSSHVLRQAVDPGRQDGNLNLRRTGVHITLLELVN